MSELERFSSNIDYLFQAIAELIDTEPKSVPVNYIDEQGNTNQYLLKNVSQYVSELLTSFKNQQNLYEKEIYVDPTNGNDLNTGNADSPIKTFKEALNRTNNIAHSKIILLDDLSINWSDYYNYQIIQKTIRICSSPNNTSSKLIVNLDGKDDANFGSILSVGMNGVLSFECDVDISNPDTEQRWFVALNGGKVIQNFNYGKFVGEGKAEAITITIGNYSVFTKSLFGSIEATYLYSSLNDADTSRYALLSTEPTELKIVYPSLSYMNGNALNNQGELAKWIDSIDIDGNQSNGFLLDSNNSNRATNAVCNPIYLQTS